MGERQKQKSYELVATSNGFDYSMKLQREKYWVHFGARPIPEYTPFENYKPHHLKNLRRGLKLFLSAHWPGYAKHPKQFTNIKG